MNKRIINYMGCGMLLTVLAGVTTACVESFLPEVKDAYDRDASFTTTVWKPVLGKTSFLTGTFNSGNATLPLTFEIQNMRHVDGTPAPELEAYYPVRVWKKPYLGNETSIEEIEAKRGIEYRRLFDVRKHSGEFIMWSEANSEVIRCQPDSGYVFDVLASNSGGYKYTTKMRLMPHRERYFEPTIFDEVTGMPTVEYVNPDVVNLLRNKGASSYSSYYSTTDVYIYFQEVVDSPDKHNTLTLEFFDKDWSVIDPKRFNETNWNTLVHGFINEITDKHVKYDVVYPMPLFDGMQTQYTNTAGDRAHLVLSASYMDRYYRRSASIQFDFAIYKEGHWKIIFYFATGTPQLGDE